MQCKHAKRPACDGAGEDALKCTPIEAAEDFAWHAEFPQNSQEVQALLRFLH